jgi:conjugative relaxase-like TrwC/TraI family protein
VATVCLLLVVVSGQARWGPVVRVVRVTALANAEYLIGSVALGIEEYYLGVGEAPGVWAGRWTGELGLVGVVEADQLRALVEGRHPVSGEDLVKGLRGRSVRAFDVTFSAPKSVSLLWALGSPEAADAVMRAHVDAVDVAVRFLESRAAVARQQVDGVRRRVSTNGLVVAAFVHRTSREGDPQLHSHCLVPNLVRRVPDGRVVALDGYPLHVWARAAGSVYQAELQRHLSRSLHVGWGEDRRNTRDLVGISVEQRRVFSKRSGQIEAELEAIGAAKLEDPGVRMRADDVASLATRAAKDRSLTPARLAEQWATEATAAGLPVGGRLDAAVHSRERRVEALSFEEISQVLVDPEVGLCSRSARFSEADVVEHICAMAAGHLTVDDVEAYSKRFLDSEHVVRLVPSTDAVVRRLPEWSTVAHRALEDRVLGLLDRLAVRPVEALAGAERVLEAAGRLGEDQVAAVRVLCGSGGSVRCVLAPAGFGKTAMVHAAAAVAAEAGRPVVGVATTGKAVAELEGAGLPNCPPPHRPGRPPAGARHRDGSGRGVADLDP